MTFRQTFVAAVLLVGIAHSGAAQSAPSSSATPVATTGTIDVSRLPIDMRRIEREFRQTQIREERAGLNLRYFVEVYGQAPPLRFLDKERDNLQYGPTPHGAPTHRDILWMLTPEEHRGGFYALQGFRLPIGGSKKGK